MKMFFLIYLGLGTITWYNFVIIIVMMFIFIELFAFIWTWSCLKVLLLLLLLLEILLDSSAYYEPDYSSLYKIILGYGIVQHHII